MRKHFCMSISGALHRFNPKDWVDVMRDPDMKRYLHPIEVRQRLEDLLDTGAKVLPMDGCDNFDDQVGCLGHSDSEAHCDANK